MNPGFVEKDLACRKVGAAAATHAPRGANRSCSEGRPVFFCWCFRPGPPPRARSSPDWPACRARPSARPRCDPGAPRSARPECAGAAPTSGAARAAGRAVRLRPSPAGAASAAAPTTRSRGTSPRRPRPSSRHHCRAGLAEIHRISRSSTTKPAVRKALDIQCQRGASVKIGWKYLDD